MGMMLADMQDLPAFTAVLGNEMVITNGHDRPRYIDPGRGVAGFLGFREWAVAAFTPTVASTGSGALDASKWYAIKVVPADTDRSYMATLVLAGPESLPSAGQTGSTAYTFNIPVHPDQEVVFAGLATAIGTDTITFAADSFISGVHVGRSLRNVETGDSYAITANNGNTITAAGSSAAVGDRFHVERSAAKVRYIYAAEADSAEALQLAAFQFQGQIDGNEADTWELDEFAPSGVYPADIIQPPNACVCESANKRLFLAGGIRFSAEAWVDTTTPGAHVVHGIDLKLAEGCIAHSLTWEGESETYRIESVDPVAQTCTIDRDYTGAAISEETAGDVLMVSRNELYRSEVNNPHNYSLAFTHEISGNTRRLVAYTNALFIFTDTELYLLPYEAIDEGFPEHVFSNIVISAPHAIAASNTNGVLFWDGAGFSVTDGIRVNSVTNTTCRWLMDGVNPEMTHNFRATWNNQESRWEVAFAYGNGITNDYGLYITEDYRVYGIMRFDMNAIWQDVSDDGRPEMRHGTSARTTGQGIIWRHNQELASDGVPEDSAMLGVVTAYNVDTRTVTIECATQVSVLPGVPLVFLGSGSTFSALAASITETGTEPYVYDVVLGQDWQGAQIGIGSTAVFGGIPFVYGVRWSDFQSPQYRHQVRRTELDIEPTVGYLAIEHYQNLDEREPLHTEVREIGMGDTKVVFPLRKSAIYQYGFRLRGVCLDRILIDGFSTLFDTQV